MSILVTGVAGFIGSSLVDELLAQGESVIGIDNLDNYYSVDVKLSNIVSAQKNSNFKFYCVDFTQKKALKQIFESHNFNKIIHIGAKAGVRPSIDDPYSYIKTNIVGTLNILEFARIYNIKKVVVASSSSVYGNNEKIPFSEKDFVDNPISPYAASKKSVELFCHTYHHLYGINIVCLRFFTVYGPRGRPDMAIYKFTNLIDQGKEIDMYGDGTTKRDYTFISDIVSGIIASANIDVGFEVINLGNSETVELKRLISIIENNLGKKAIIRKLPMQAGDVEKTNADITKAKKLLGYNPKIDIETGIKVFVEWFIENKT